MYNSLFKVQKVSKLYSTKLLWGDVPMSENFEGSKEERIDTFESSFLFLKSLASKSEL
jgi:hypothetical protein